MAVDITVAQLLAALRLGSGTEETAQATRLLAYATAAVEKHAPDAPATVQNEAVIRLAGYLFDQPTAPSGATYANALRNSGAAAILLPYRVHRAGNVADATPAGMEGSIGNPVVNVTVSGSTLTVHYANGTTADRELPETGDGPGVDQVAREAAAAAQQAADSATTAVTALQQVVAALRLVPGAGTIGQVLKRIAGANNAYGWQNEASAGGGGVDQTARDAAAAAAQQAETNRVEIGRNSSAVVTARSEAGRAQRTAEAAQDAIPAKASNADVDGETDDDDFTTVAKVFRAIARKVKNASTTIRGIVLLARNEDVDATETDTARVPDVARVKRMIQRLTANAGGRGKVVLVTDTITPAVIQTRVAGEQAGDLVIGYSASVIAIFRFVAPPTNAFVEVVRWPRVATARRTDTELETFIESIVSAWAIQGSADGIPGSKTFDGLFKSEQQTAIPAANVAVAFDVGTNADANEVDETDAAATSFNITAEQANQPGGFLRVRYNLTRTAAEGALPRDIELILQVQDTGAAITKHNLKDEGEGTAQFAFGDAGRKRWAVRCVTTGRYAGTVTITEATFHSAEPLADAPIQHVVHPIVSDEAEKRQSEDARLQADITRVESIKAIVNGLPAATVTTKNAIQWKDNPVYQQTDADRFQVPATGFVQFVFGNLASSPIMRAEDCVNRIITVYNAVGAGGVYHALFVSFDAARNAQLNFTQAVPGQRPVRSTLATDIAPTTTNYRMLHWAPARASGHATTELADLETRVEALEAAGGGGSWSRLGSYNFTRAKESFHTRYQSRELQNALDGIDGLTDLMIGIGVQRDTSNPVVAAADSAIFPYLDVNHSTFSRTMYLNGTERRVQIVTKATFGAQMYFSPVGGGNTLDIGAAIAIEVWTKS